MAIYRLGGPHSKSPELFQAAQTAIDSGQTSGSLVMGNQAVAWGGAPLPDMGGGFGDFIQGATDFFSPIAAPIVAIAEPIVENIVEPIAEVAAVTSAVAVGGTTGGAAVSGNIEDTGDLIDYATVDAAGLLTGAVLSEALAANAFTAGAEATVTEEAAALGISDVTAASPFTVAEETAMLGVGGDASIASPFTVAEEAAMLGVSDEPIVSSAFTDGGAAFTLEEEAAMLGVSEPAALPTTATVFTLEEEAAMLGIADTGGAVGSGLSLSSLPSVPGIISTGGEATESIFGGEGGSLPSLPSFDDLFSKLAPHLQNELLKFLRGTPQPQAARAPSYAAAGFGGDLGGMSPLAKGLLALAAGAMIAIPLRGSARVRAHRRSAARGRRQLSR